MEPEVNRIGRLVQCRCRHTCISHDLGYQWLLPRTKSKHMLYDRVKNKQTKKPATSIDQLENRMASISIRKTQKKRSFKISILLKKNLKQIACENDLAALKEFTVKSSPPSIPRDFRYGNDYY